MNLWKECLEALWDIIEFTGFIFARPEDIKSHPINMDPVDATIPPITIEPPPLVVKKSLDDFATAIRDYEGKPGDRNYRNNNAGNCKYSSVGYASIYGHVGKDKDGFAIFKDYATGFLYLKNLIISKVSKNPNMTILDYIKIHAPTGDNNDPALYAVFVARRLGVKTDFLMRNIV